MWQFIKKRNMISKLGIDHVFIGYGDKTVPEAFKNIIAKKPLPQMIVCEDPEISDIKEIMGPSSMGIVEIGRWCGRGCKFCIMGNKPMLHIPKNIILSEIQTNLKHGVKNIATLSEDFLRYGSNGVKPDEKKVLGLYESIAKLSGLRLVQVDHVNIVSVALVSENMLKQIHDTISLYKSNEWVWVNAGIETASLKLLKQIAPAKTKPFHINGWCDIVRQSIGKLNDAGFMPLVSIILGAPQETEDDVNKTREFLDDIKTMRIAVFPVFYVGVGESESSFYVDDMKPYHWKLFIDAYELNFKWIPKLVSKNQKYGGVSFKRQLITQIMGHLWIFTMRRKIKKLSGGAVA